MSHNTSRSHTDEIRSPPISGRGRPLESDFLFFACTAAAIICSRPVGSDVANTG